MDGGKEILEGILHEVGVASIDSIEGMDVEMEDGRGGTLILVLKEGRQLSVDFKVRF